TLFFGADNGVSGKELWKSNGSAAGTILIKDINPGAAKSLAAFSFLTDVNGTLFFSATNGVSGYELWRSNGTGAGTALVKGISVGTSASYPGGSYPGDLRNVNGTLFFAAGEAAHGLELWKSNGAAAGTVLVKDINPGSGRSQPEALTNVNGTLFFQANNGV